MSKVKFTREQVEAFEYLKSKFGNEVFLKYHSNTKNSWESEKSRAMNGVSLYDVAQALLIGYEVEETFSVDDWVVIIDCKNPMLVGKTMKVTRLEKVEQYIRVWYDFDIYWTIKHNTELRHATIEEIKAEKERRLWESLSREVGEFRVGDVCRYRSPATYEIESEYDIEMFAERYTDGKLTGFFPVEAFVDFNEGADSNE